MLLMLLTDCLVSVYCKEKKTLYYGFSHQMFQIANSRSIGMRGEESLKKLKAQDLVMY